MKSPSAVLLATIINSVYFMHVCDHLAWMTRFYCLLYTLLIYSSKPSDRPQVCLTLDVLHALWSLPCDKVR